MQQPIHLLDQMIESLLEKATDLDNTAHDKARSTVPLEQQLAVMHSTAAFTIRMVVAELVRVQGAYTSNLVDEMTDILETTKQRSIDLKALDAWPANVVPLIPRGGGSDAGV